MREPTQTYPNSESVEPVLHHVNSRVYQKHEKGKKSNATVKKKRAKTFVT